MKEKDIRICQVCEKEIERINMDYTKDCHGITYRLVCYECYKKLMSKGYDGEYYEDTDDNDCMDYWR